MTPSRQYTDTGIGLLRKDVALEQRVGKPYKMLVLKLNVWTNGKVHLRHLTLGNIFLTLVKLSFLAVASYLSPTPPSSQRRPGLRARRRLLRLKLQLLLPLQPHRCLIQPPIFWRASLPAPFQIPPQPQWHHFHRKQPHHQPSQVQQREQ